MLHRAVNCLLLGSLALLLAAAVGPAAAYQITLAGAQPVGHGLTPASGPGVGHVAVTAGGRACWATDRRHGQYLIAVRISSLPPAPTPAPLHVTVTFLDFGYGQWALAYHTAEGGLRHSLVVQKYNTAAWRQANFDLSDFTGDWLAVDSFGAMVDQDDDYISSVAVRAGGPAILTPPVLPAGEKVTLQALYWAPDVSETLKNLALNARNGGLKWMAADKLALKASAGEIPPTVTVGEKPVDFSYTAPATAGVVVLQALAAQSQATERVLIWAGHAPLETESVLVDPAFGLAGWSYWPFAARLGLGTVATEAQAGGGGASVAYTWTGPYQPGYVDLTRRTFLRGAPLDVNLEVQGDSAGARVQAILEDATGQRFCYDLGPIKSPEWTSVRLPVQGPTRYWGGAKDGLPHYPLYFLSLRIVQGPEGTPASGEIHLRDVFVRTLAPTP